MRRGRFIWIALCLLCVAGAWLLWLHGRNGSPSRPPEAVAPAVRPYPPSSVATSRSISTNAAQISLMDWNTNKFAGRLSNTTKAIGQLVNDSHAILLENAFIDTANPRNFVFPQHLQPAGDPGAYIIQANGPIDNAFRALLAQAGATIVSYIPNDAYLVRASAGVAGSLEANPSVQAVVPYEPYYKIQSSLLPKAVEQMDLPDDTVLTLGLFADDAPATVQQIEKLGGQVVGRDRSPFGPIVRVLPPRNWTTLATLSGVQIVEPFHARATANDLARATVGVAADSFTQTNYLGLTGTNVMVEVNDTGIDKDHPDFAAGGVYNRAIGVIGDAPQSLVDTNGHGTHVAGIIAGSGLESTTVTNVQGSVVPGTNFQFRGMAPGATLYSVGGIFGGADTNFISDQYFQEVPALTNALISNNSWVFEGDNAYDLSAASYDAAVRDALPTVTGSQPVLFVFAAGNAGNGADDSDFGGGIADSIESPATAKNVITVGAIQEDRNITNTVTNAAGSITAPWQAETSTKYRVAGFSSRGNVGVGTEGTFGRFKPDVAAPGTFIVSTRSEQWDIGTYFFQNPTNHQIQVHTGIPLQPGSLFKNVFPSAPTNAVQLIIDIFPPAQSPFLFNDLPIYVGLFTSTNYDFFTTNDQVLIPGSPEAPGNYLQQIFSTEGFLGGFKYAVSNNTSIALTFDLVTDVITTNGAGNFFLVLSNLDQSIGTLNPGSTGPGPYYRFESGTSMAAPMVSGMLALMQEFYAGAYGVRPSPAMLKAMLINGARVTGFNNYQAQNSLNPEGWGLINLPDSLPPGITNQLAQTCSAFVQDQNPTNALATGDSQTFFVATTNALPVRFTLAWTDPPGDPTAAIKLVNNLVLIVTNYVGGFNNSTNFFVYYGNDIPAASTFNASHATNTPPVFDTINNVQNVNLPVNAGTNFSVTVLGYRVNVNAVTAQTNNVVQDYALVMSCGNGQVTNVMTVSSAPAVSATPPVVASNPTGDQQITFITGNDQVMVNQFAGASTPLLGTNTVPIGTIMVLSTNLVPIPLSPGFGSNAVVTVGMTNQWHFYVMTNTFAATNSAFTNAAFVTFNPNAPDPDTLSVPREGVFADSMGNASRDADIDLYVTTDPTITNLNPVAISNCVHGTQIGLTTAGPTFNGASLGRGTTEFVADIGSLASEVYYIGVKSEDQMAAEYGFISIFSATPFSQMQNGNQVVNGVPLPVNIPDGSPSVPGKGYIFGLALFPIQIGGVTVSDSFLHQHYEDLIGTLTLNGGHADVLNNHDSFVTPLPPGPYNLNYDDSAGGNPNTRPSDGPGSLIGYAGHSGGPGVWLLSEVDDSLTQTGLVQGYTLTIQPHQDLTKNVATVVVPGGSWFYDFIDVPPGATNLTVFATNLTATANPPLILFVKLGSQPTINSFDGSAIISTPTGIGTVEGTVSLGPPLTSGRYWVGVFNPNPLSAAQTVQLFATIGLPSVPGQVIFSSSGPVPIRDDAVTTDFIFVPADQIISSLDVALSVQHPRISDLVFHLISPDGTRVLLMENRGATDPNGAGGVATITTNNVLTNSFDTVAPTNYNSGASVAGWTVTTNQVSVAIDPANASPGNNNLLALANGGISANLPTVPGAIYTLKFAYRGPGIAGWWRGESNTLDSVGLNNGTPVGSLSYTNGEVGRSFAVSSTATYVDVLTSPSLDVGSGNGFTVEEWINPGDVSAQHPLTEWNRDATTIEGVHFWISVGSPGTVYANLIDTGNVSHQISSAPGFVQPNVFQHVALSYNRTTGITKLYYNGAIVANNNLGIFPPKTTTDLLFGHRVNTGEFFIGALDEIGLYQRVLSDSEIQAIFQNRITGKFDTNEFSLSPQLSLAEAQVSINGSTLTNLFGNNTNWQTYTVSFKATSSSTPVQIQGVEPGMLLDAASVVSLTTNFNYLVFTENTNLTTTPIKFAAPPFAPATNVTVVTNIIVPGVTNITTNTGLFYLPEESLDTFDGLDALGTWTLEVQDDRVGATNLAPTLLSWQLRFNFVTGTTNGSIPPGITQTNVTPANSFTYYRVVVPTNADWATNILVFASGPLNMWFNSANNPVGTTPPDYLLLGGVTGGSAALNTLSAPTNIVPGGVYFIGLQNTNNFQVTNAFLVNFHFFPTLTNGVPITNTLPASLTVTSHSFGYYLVTVPTNADYATNTLLFATLPVNLWFNQSNAPIGVNPPDSLLITNATNGVSILNPATTPPLLPGSTYYLAIQNTNGVPVTIGLVVDFHLVTTNITGPTITRTNINGTNGFLLQWSGPTNYQYTIQWKTNLAPTIPWNTVANPVINVTYIFATGNYSWFDDGSLTGGFGPSKFYRVLANFISPPITNSSPTTNIVVSGTITPLTVTVPADAIAATNVLVSATGPVNVYFNQTGPPTGTNPGDVLMLSTSTGGTFVLNGSSVPPLVPGANYYLGVQNPGPGNVSFVFQVNFAFSPPTNPPAISSITLTNVNGTNAVLLKWIAPTNYQFQVQWATNLAPAILWQTISNVVLTWSGVLSPTNTAYGIFQFLDDGSLTGGFGPLKFYRLIEYPYSTPIPQSLIIINSGMIGGSARFQWVAPTNYQYQVLWTTNLGLPLASWSILANPALGLSNGVYTFMDTTQTGPPTSPKFFRVFEY